MALILPLMAFTLSLWRPLNFLFLVSFIFFCFWYLGSCIAVGLEPPCPSQFSPLQH
jgi:hypothetical protein